MNLKAQLRALAGCIVLSASIVHAETTKPVNNTTKPIITSTKADANDGVESDSTLVLDEIIVRAQSSNIERAFGSYLDRPAIARARISTNDTAQLFNQTPGMSFSGGGGMSGRPVLNGMADDRVRIQIDGMNLISACGNHMNPALSYVAPSSVLSAQVLAGVTPVSMGGDSIAGTIRVQSADPMFAEKGKSYLISGQASTFYRSNSNATGGNLTATLANRNASLTYTGSTVQARDYQAGGDFTSPLNPNKNTGGAQNVVGSSAFKSQNQSVSLGLRTDDEKHLVTIKVGDQNNPYQGFPNVRMDMMGDRSWFANISSKSQFDWGRLETLFYHQDAQHYMNFMYDKVGTFNTLGMPMNTHGQNTGGLVKGIINIDNVHQLTSGAELQIYRLNDWWPAIGAPAAGQTTVGMMRGPGPYWNINNGQRDRYELFTELDSHWNKEWYTQLGVRAGAVHTGTGPVSDYGWTTDAKTIASGGNGISEALQVNAQNKNRTRAIVDVTALGRFTPDENQQYELGFARKTRVANLYELYAWSRFNGMNMNMINFQGDGNGYVGNNALKPEVAYTVSGSADFHDAHKEDWHAKITPYYTYVNHFIDASNCLPANGVPCPVATNGFKMLQYGNYNAQFFGVNASGSKVLLKTNDYGSLSSRAILSYVRGRNITQHDNVYQQMPVNATLALDYRWQGLTATIETKLVAAKDNVNAMRNEIKTGGYSLLNLRASYDWKYVRVDAGIDNVTDTLYTLPLGGVYLGDATKYGGGSPNGVGVPGYGRSYNLGLTVTY